MSSLRAIALTAVCALTACADDTPPKQANAPAPQPAETARAQPKKQQGAREPAQATPRPEARVAVTPAPDRDVADDVEVEEPIDIPGAMPIADDPAEPAKPGDKKQPKLRYRLSTLRSGVPVVHVFDERDRLIAIIGKEYKEYFRYDNTDLLRIHQGPDGRERFMAYDAQRRLKKSYGPAGVTTYTRDAQGRVLTVTTPGGRVWSFTYAGKHLVGEDGPMGPVTHVNDAEGKAKQIRDGSGRRTFIARTARVTDYSNADGDSMQHTVDAKGRLTRVQAGDEVVRYGYDGQGRMVRVRSRQATFTYAHEKRAKRLKTPWAELVRVRSGERVIAIQTPAGWFKFAYDKARRIGVLYPSGVEEQTWHDRMLRIAGKKSPALDFRTGYDKKHERAFVRLDGVTTRYHYDAVGRLAKIVRGGQTIRAFGYDKDGNRTRDTRPTGTRQATFDQRGRIVTYGKDRFEHDGAGRLISRKHAQGEDTFRYDGFGRLSQVARAGKPKVTYTYNGLNQIVTRRVGTRTTRFVYEGDKLLAQLGPGKRVRVFVQGDDQSAPLGYFENGVWTGMHTDDRGNVLAYTDASGKRVAQVRFSAFGELRQAARGRPMFYAARWVDPVAQVVPMRARVYDPALGRFLTPDPSGLDGGLNAYVYVENDPMSLVDPNGLQGTTIDELLRRRTPEEEAQQKRELLDELLERNQVKQTVKRMGTWIPTPKIAPPKLEGMWKAAEAMKRAVTKRYSDVGKAAEDIETVLEHAPGIPDRLRGLKNVASVVKNLAKAFKVIEHLRPLVWPTPEERADPLVDMNRLVHLLEVSSLLFPAAEIFAKLVAVIRDMLRRIHDDPNNGIGARNNAINSWMKENPTRAKVAKQALAMAKELGEQAPPIDPAAVVREFAESQLKSQLPELERLSRANRAIERNADWVRENLANEGGQLDRTRRRLRNGKTLADWLKDRERSDARNERRRRASLAKLRKSFRDYYVAKKTYGPLIRNPELLLQQEGYDFAARRAKAAAEADAILEQTPEDTLPAPYGDWRSDPRNRTDFADARETLKERERERGEEMKRVARPSPEWRRKNRKRRKSKMRIGRSDGKPGAWEGRRKKGVWGGRKYKGMTGLGR